MAGLGEHLGDGRLGTAYGNGRAENTEFEAAPSQQLNSRGQNAQEPPGLARDPEMRARLARTIEGEIIPRLKLAHAAQSPTACECRAFEATGHITPDDILAFAKLVIANEVGVALAHIEVVRAQGSSLDCIFLDLLAPTARIMGDMWLADECSFIDVTIGLARLQQIVRDLSADFEPELDEARPRRRALLMPAPGEQHSLGIAMVEQFFRRAGWEVAASPQNASELLGTVRKDWFAMVGFSVGCVELIDSLQTVIRSMRHTSRNPDLVVMVGGAAFSDQPELVSRVGADAMAVDGRQAVLAANGLLSATTPAPAPDRSRSKANWKRNGASGLTRYGTPV